MLFSSYQFIGFLIILFLLYYCIPAKHQWKLLLAASYCFYLFSGAEYLLYILATTGCIYLAGRMIGANLEAQKAYLKEHKAQLSREEKKQYKNGQNRIRKNWLLFGLLCSLGILFVVKYLDFMIENINRIVSLFGQTGRLSFFSLALPLGISFYTFQALGYLIDVYRGNVAAEKNFFKFALFVSFFPQLIQGPISRFGDLSRTLYSEHRFCAKQVSFGLQRMLWGYFKKLVVADRILAAVSTVIGDPDTYYGAYALAGMLFYTIQLYADFTGGIDITIGIAEALGITVQENFCRPYFSKSLKEYWRRWHISMCTWFKDYLFYPVSTSHWMQRFMKFSRGFLGEKAGKRLPVYVSTFIVWLATGIWHGASWNFVVWGLANWVVLMASEELEPLYVRFHNRFQIGRAWGYKVFQILRTFALICILNLFDCYEAVGTTFRMFGSMLKMENWEVFWNGALLELGLSGLDYVILAVSCVLLVAVSLLQRKKGIRERISETPYAVRACIWGGLFFVVLLMGSYGIGYDASQFIYNRF